MFFCVFVVFFVVLSVLVAVPISYLFVADVFASINSLCSGTHSFFNEVTGEMFNAIIPCRVIVDSNHESPHNH